MAIEDPDELSENRNESESQLGSLRESISEKETIIERLESQLDNKEERIQELKERLKQDPKPSQTSQQPSETTSQTSQDGSAAGSKSSAEPQRESSDELVEKLEERDAEYDDDWNTQPSEARSREVVLRNNHVVRKVQTFWKELDDLSHVERKTLRWFKSYGPTDGEKAFKKAAGPITKADAQDVIRTLESDGFIVRNGREAYEYNLDTRIQNRFYDILHRKEIPYVINAVEEKL